MWSVNFPNARKRRTFKEATAMNLINKRCVCTPIHCEMECPACGGPSSKEPCQQTVFCWYCCEQILENGVPVFDHHSEELAHDSCRAAADEAAYDRSVEDFYGSSSPQTERE